MNAGWRMDPQLPFNALRITLDLGVQGALDPREAQNDVDLADEVDRQQQAFDVVRDLFGMHHEVLENLRVSREPDAPTPGM